MGVGGQGSGQGGWDERSEAFVRIQKKKKIWGGSGRAPGGRGVVGPNRGWGGGGGGSKVWGRWVMWGMGDVNQELKALINVNKGFVQY